MNKPPQNTVLIAIVKEPSDFQILWHEGWYRIPVEHAPEMVRDGAIQYLGFYFPGNFGEQAYSIRWYGKVRKIERAGRKQLFPAESPSHPKANRSYYQIFIEELLPLPAPILSQYPRGLIFAPTTEARFFNLPEPDINQVFNASPIEDLLWERLRREKIPAERQVDFMAGGKYWVLDFAIFCQTQPLAIECDGDTWHTSASQVKYDKHRDNLILSAGWTLLRYTTDDLTKEMDRTIFQIKDNIERLGGLKP